MGFTPQPFGSFAPRAVMFPPTIYEVPENLTDEEASRNGAASGGWSHHSAARTLDANAAEPQKRAIGLIGEPVPPSITRGAAENWNS